MSTVNFIGLVSAILISLVGASISTINAVANFRARKRKEEADADVRSAEVGVTKETENEIAAKAASINQAREIERDQHWQKKLDATEGRCNDQVQSLKEEINVLEAFIDHTVPWIWGAVRKMKLNDIEHDDPPSLSDIRRQLREMKEEERRGA